MEKKFWTYAVCLEKVDCGLGMESLLLKFDDIGEISRLFRAANQCYCFVENVRMSGVMHGANAGIQSDGGINSGSHFVPAPTGY